MQYDMQERTERVTAPHWFWIVTPGDYEQPAYFAVMDDFGALRRVKVLPLALSLAN